MLDKLNFGDIVTVDNYPTQYFRINGFQTNILESKNEPTLTEYWLDLTCAHTGGYTMAFADEVTLVALADEADAFLADKPAPDIADFGGIALMSIFDFERETPVGPPRTPKSKATLAAEKEAKINTLLDEMNDVRSIMATIGDSDGGYARRLSEINAELEALV